MLGCDDGDDLAFVGEIQRVQPEDLAYSTHSFANGQGVFFQTDSAATCLGELAEHGRHAAAGGVPHAVDVRASGEHGGDQPAQGLAIRLHTALQSQLAPGIDDGRAVVADVAVDQYHVAGSGTVGADVYAVGNDADACRVDEQLVRAAAWHHLGVARDDAHSRRHRCSLHGGHHPAQLGDGQPLLEDHAAGEVERARAAHGQVVDGAGHGELADVAAGEEQRGDNVGVGGHRQPVAVRGKFGKVDARLVFEGGEHRVVEGAHEQVVDQVAHGLAAAAV